MRQHSFFTRSAAVAAAALILSSSSVGRAAVPTKDELDRLAAGTDYKATANALKVVLKLDRKAKVAAAYDFVHVWTLLAEVDLNQGDFAAASAAAKKASAEAEADERVQDADEALALSRLTDLSKKTGVYTTRNGPNKGRKHTVTDPAQRPEAYADLLDDEVAAANNDQYRAKSKRTIDAMLAAADNFKSLRAMDRLVNHNTAVTDPLSAAMAKDAAALIQTWMKDRSGDLDNIAADAKKVVRKAQAAQHGAHVNRPGVAQQLQGLTPANRQKVRMVADTTAAMDGAVERLNNGFARPGILSGIHSVSETLNRKANALLDNYPG